LVNALGGIEAYFGLIMLAPDFKMRSMMKKGSYSGRWRPAACRRLIKSKSVGRDSVEP
jgi:hypothetical protein